MPSNDEEKATKQARLEELNSESSEAAALKREVETQLKLAAAPIKKLARDKVQLQREIKQAEGRFREAEKRLKDTRIEMQQREAESEQAKRLLELEELKGKLGGVVEEEKALREHMNTALRTYQELEPIVEDSKARAGNIERQIGAVQHKISNLQSSSGSRASVFGGQSAARLAQAVSFICLLNCSCLSLFF